MITKAIQKPLNIERHGKQNDLDYEKRAMERVWKEREVQIKKTLLNASRMYGELQGVMGNAFPDIKTFSPPQGDEKSN